MVTEDRLNVGVIGAGWVAGARHVPSLERIPEVRIVSVLDSKIERARSLCANNEATATTEVDEFFEHDDLDLVVICTPPWSHAELATRAFDRSAHVLCEKPMAMNLDEAKSMATAATEANKILVISHNFLYSRAMQKYIAWRPKLGAIQYVSATQMSSFDRRLPTWHEQLPAGLFFDELPHLVYTITGVIGPSDPQHVRRVRGANGSTVIEVEITSATAPARITTVLGAPVSEWHITIVGENGVVDLDLFRDIAVFIGSDGAHEAKDILRSSASAVIGHTLGFVQSGVELVRKRQTWGHEELVRRTVLACLDRGEPPVSLKDEVAVAETTQQIMDQLQSLDT